MFFCFTQTMKPWNLRIFSFFPFSDIPWHPLNNTSLAPNAQVFGSVKLCRVKWCSLCPPPSWGFASGTVPPSSHLYNLSHPQLSPSCVVLISWHDNVPTSRGRERGRLCLPVNTHSQCCQRLGVKLSKGLLSVCIPKLSDDYFQVHHRMWNSRNWINVFFSPISSTSKKRALT